MSVEVDPADEPLTAVEVGHGPARVSAVGATVAALVAALANLPASVIGFGVSLFGFVGLAIGLFVLPSRRLSGLGTGIVFLGVVLTGVFGPDPVLVVTGVLASILAFDLSQNAFGVGEQLSKATETWRGESVHAAGSLAAGAVSAALAFGIYLVLAGGQLEPFGLVLLFAGAVALVYAIRA